MDVVDPIAGQTGGDGKDVVLYAFAYAGLDLRNATSLMNRITDTLTNKVLKVCRNSALNIVFVVPSSERLLSV